VNRFIEVIKPKQTTLLMVTCIVSYIVASNTLNRQFDPVNFLKTCVATALAISGTTALNMWLDRDIDALMYRTRNRPVPSGRLSPRACALYGSALFSIGFLLGLSFNVYLAFVLFLGLVFDIFVYTILLKRKSPYSIVLGGFAGAMPALAGWVAVRNEDILGGLIISSIVLLWIPAHIWYISMHYEEDYRRARIPMYPLIVGMEKASWTIVFTTSIILILIAVLYILVLKDNLYLIISSFAITYFLYKAVEFARDPNRFEAKKMYKLASMTLGIIYISMLICSFF